MLFGHLLTNSASIFGDIRTYWSPDAVERVTGHTLTGRASGGSIHFLNSGAAALGGTGRLKRDGGPVMKAFWEISAEEAAASLDSTRVRPASMGYFSGCGIAFQFLQIR